MENLPPPQTGYILPTHPIEPAVGVTEVLVPVPPYNVLLAMNVCVISRENQDQTFDTEVFMYDFESCKNV